MKIKEYSPSIQVPSQAFLTTIILKDIDRVIKENPSKTLKSFYEEQMKRSNLFDYNSEFQIINQGYIMMLAYAIIVIPYQNYKNIDMDFDKIEAIKDFKVDDKYKSMKNKDIVRHLRNSISHVRYKIREDGRIVFCDEYKGKGSFYAEIDDKNFYKFLDEFFKKYYEKYVKNMK